MAERNELPIEFYDSSVPETDHFLSFIVSQANDMAGEFPITLFLGGTAITGILIGGRAYFDEVARLVMQGTEGQIPAELVDNYRSMWSMHGSRYPSEGLAERETAGEDLLRFEPVGFIHLRNAKFAFGSVGFAPQGDGMLWRGRLSEVSGFSYGRLGSD